jgi:hypothetical protein
LRALVHQKMVLADCSPLHSGCVPWVTGVWIGHRNAPPLFPVWPGVCILSMGPAGEAQAPNCTATHRDGAMWMRVVCLVGEGRVGRAPSHSYGQNHQAVWQWYVRYAWLLARHGQDWKRARHLLADDWSSARRDYLQGLARDYIQPGTGKLYCASAPADWPLRQMCQRLALSGEREGFGEARTRYAKARAALADGCLYKTLAAVRAALHMSISSPFSAGKQRSIKTGSRAEGNPVGGVSASPCSSAITPGSNCLKQDGD